MSSDHDQHDALEAQLSAMLGGGPLGPGPEPATPHIDDELLARFAEGSKKPSRAHRRHLAECPECREVLAMAAHELPPDVVPSALPWWRNFGRVGFPAALAVAAALIFAVGPQEWWAQEGFQSRGESVGLGEASLTILSTGPKGRTVLVDGARVGLDGQLGFRYGNPQGTARTLTILGYDGEKIRWYYPESASGEPASLESGVDAVSRRLPFDIRLADSHRPGRLEIYAAFDVVPAELAASILRGEPLSVATRVSVELFAP